MSHEYDGVPLAFGEQGLIKLRGPFGQILTLEGSGQQSLEWAPIDRRAEQVEVRAFIQDYGPDPGFPSTAPLVRWRAHYGHGQSVYSSPILMPFTIEGGVDAFQRNVFPARGLVFRMASRELKMIFDSPCKLDNTPPWSQVHVVLSIQPVPDSIVAVVPRQHYSSNTFGISGFPLEPFPPEANEFRLFDEQGQPYPIGSGLITFFTLGGSLIAAPSIDINTYATFQPIPVHAACWGPPFDPLGSGFMVSAEYR